MNDSKNIFDKVSISCSKLVTKSYSTSFSLGIKLLNKKYREPIYAIYGFVRLADEIVDSFHDYDKKKLMTEFRYATIDAIEKKISLNPILNSFQKYAKEYNIEWELIDVFLESMEYDLNNSTCDKESYKQYIRGSAEAVGLMCLQVFSKEDPTQYKRLKPFAISLGSAFQKINFLRDLADDYNILNRIYFPDIDITKFTDKEKGLIEDDIEKDFKLAFEGIQKLNLSSRSGVYLAYIYYISLFKKIKKTPANKILEKRIRISNIKKIFLLLISFIKLRKI
jgi:phytoene synthase